jgi:Protein of unknown function (DUF2950)
MSETGRKLLGTRALFLGLATSIVAVTIASLPAWGQQSPQGSKSSLASQETLKGKSFASPEDAAAALYAAARRDDDTGLLAVLGSDAKEVLMWSDDAKERAARREHFADKYDQMHRLVQEPDKTVALYVGAENWPFPIPIVQLNGAWYFDTELGRQEILYRRIGRNEFEALQVCHALVDAEKDYYATAHQYTAKFMSSDNAHDGLYWSAAEGAKKSPIGPHLANAGISSTNNSAGTPFHGYYYRIVVQNSSFAIVAFPADYRSSGVMTFIMGADATAYEKDLGQTTATLATQVTSGSPDSSWKKVE